MALLSTAVAALFASFAVVPFFAHKPGPSFADGTPAAPALQAAAEPYGLYDCATEYAVVFIPQPELERTIHVEVVRQDKRDHGTGAEPRPS